MPVNLVSVMSRSGYQPEFYVEFLSFLKAKLGRDRFEARTWYRGYKTFFMLNSAEIKIYITNKFQNSPNKLKFQV